jgi:hypothetical protein
MVCWIGSKRMHLWRAVDDEGQVLDPVVQRRRNTEAAQRLLKRLLQNQPVEPQKITSDGLASYGAALHQLDPPHLHRPAGGEQPLRELPPADPTMRRQQQRFKSQASTQRLVTTYATIFNTFNSQRHLISRLDLRLFRAEAKAVWAAAVARVHAVQGEPRLAAVNLATPPNGLGRELTAARKWEADIKVGSRYRDFVLTPIRRNFMLNL